MNQKIKWMFFVLVLVQGFHSIEEYVGKIWESFPPARVLCNLVSDNHVIGFLIINLGLFVFGLWCFFFPIRKDANFARSLIGFWIFIELINGIGHSIWSIMQKAYTPGMLTAPVLLLIAIILLKYRQNEKRTKVNF